MQLAVIKCLPQLFPSINIIHYFRHKTNNESGEKQRERERGRGERGRSGEKGVRKLPINFVSAIYFRAPSRATSHYFGRFETHMEKIIFGIFVAESATARDRSDFNLIRSAESDPPNIIMDPRGPLCDSPNRINSVGSIFPSLSPRRYPSHPPLVKLMRGFKASYRVERLGTSKTRKLEVFLPQARILRGENCK